MPRITTGPWCTSRDAVPEGYTQVTIYAQESGVRVATVFETPANAQLIAKAPEMLDLIKRYRAATSRTGVAAVLVDRAALDAADAATDTLLAEMEE